MSWSEITPTQTPAWSSVDTIYSVWQWDTDHFTLDDNLYHTMDGWHDEQAGDWTPLTPSQSPTWTEITP